jgi:hypothetical protein
VDTLPLNPPNLRGTIWHPTLANTNFSRAFFLAATPENHKQTFASKTELDALPAVWTPTNFEVQVLTWIVYCDYH